MKKITLAVLLIAGLSSSAQTIVSTTPQNKKVVLEEFTGIDCFGCPQGNAIANTIKEADPNNIFVINIHATSYANPADGQPDFRTPFGNSLASQIQFTSFPCATINRKVFSGYENIPGGTAMIPNYWAVASNTIKTMPSYVNVALTGSIDVNTRLLTVHVEVYYTATSGVAYNNLNVALLQNNTLGAQSGGNLGNNYNHQHRLVHLLTGQWGEAINATTSGTFVDRTYTYTIPSAYNSISAVLGDFELVAFVSEGNQNIISANGAIPAYNGISAIPDTKVYNVNSIMPQCNNSMSPKIVLQNNSQPTLTSIPITYNINGGVNQVYNWAGSLASLERTTITLPNLTYSIQLLNSLNITLPNDANITNNFGSVSFTKAVVGTNNIILYIKPDFFGSEITWNIKNSSGTAIASGGPYLDDDIVLKTIPIALPLNDCYTFNVIDANSDGIYVDGTQYIRITDSNQLQLFYTDGNYEVGMSSNFSTNSALTVENLDKIDYKLSPNPSTGMIKINTQTPVNVIITDITGKIVYSINEVTNETSINLSSLQKGIYLAKISNGNKVQTEKIILK
jgi:hypothetical protein